MSGNHNSVEGGQAADSWRDVLLRGADKLRFRPGLRYLVPLSKAAVGYRGKRKPHLLEAEFMAIGGHRDYAVAEGPDGGRYVVMTSDQGLGRIVYAWGVYERDQLERAVRKAGVLPGKKLIDVGSNVGTAAISGVISGWFDGAVTVEADPGNARMVRTNVALNGLDGCITCFSCAAGAATGEVSFVSEPVRRGMSRVSKEGNIRVAVRRVDDMLAEAGVSNSDVGLMWVDTEGFEAEVIAGAGELFETVPWVLEMRGVFDTTAEVAGLLRGREVWVISEFDRPADRRLREEELEAIQRGAYGEISLDLLLMPKNG